MLKGNRNDPRCDSSYPNSYNKRKSLLSKNEGVFLPSLPSLNRERRRSPNSCQKLDISPTPHSFGFRIHINWIAIPTIHIPGVCTPEVNDKADDSDLDFIPTEQHTAEDAQRAARDAQLVVDTAQRVIRLAPRPRLFFDRHV